MHIFVYAKIYIPELGWLHLNINAHVILLNKSKFSSIGVTFGSPARVSGQISLNTGLPIVYVVKLLNFC